MADESEGGTRQTRVSPWAASRSLDREVMEVRTDDLYALLGPAGGLEGLAGFVDADLAAVDELVGVLFVPSAAQGVSTRCRRGQRLARRVNLPGLGVVLGVFDLVNGDDVRVLVKDEEAGRAGARRGSVFRVQHGRKRRGAYVVPQAREPTKSPCLSPDMSEAEVGVG